MILKQVKTLGKSILELITLKDTIVLKKIKRKYRGPVLNPIMNSLTLVGTAGTIWALPAFKMLTKEKTRLNGFLILFGIGANVITNNLVTKLFFHRERPCSRYPSEYLWGSLPVGYSFPSGHSLTSFTAATLFTLSNWKNIFWALPLASSIAFSRAYLFTHYPSDIFFGIANGIIDGILIYYFGHKWYKEKRFPLINLLLEDDKLFDYHTYLPKKTKMNK